MKEEEEESTIDKSDKCTSLRRGDSWKQIVVRSLVTQSAVGIARSAAVAISG